MNQLGETEQSLKEAQHADWSSYMQASPEGGDDQPGDHGVDRVDAQQ